MNIQYMSKMSANYGRNQALAGKTVSARGLNVTYDEDGYAVWAVNYKHAFLQGTQKSVRAASVDAVLNASARADFDGSPYDKQYFSDKQIELVRQLRHEVAIGEMSQSAADRLVEEVRNTYGYSGGPSGNEYIRLEYHKQPGEVLMEEQRAAQEAAGQGGTVMAASAASVSAASVPTAPSASAEQAPASEPVSAAAGVSHSRVSEAEAGRSQMMRSLYQQTLMQQQQRRSLQNVLEEQRRHDLAQRVDRSRIADRLLRLLDDDEDDEEDETAQDVQTDPMAGIE